MIKLFLRKTKKGENLMKIYMKSGMCITLNPSLEEIYKEVLRLESENKKYLVLSNAEGMTCAININDISYMGVDGIRRER